MKHISLFLLLLCAYQTKAQNYLEFVENKGQWNEQINFKGELINGAFALQKSGYRLLMYNNEDLKKRNEFFHGHTHSNNHSEAPKDFIFHSHVYEVKFLNANPNPVISAEKPLSSYNNYYIGNDSKKWASNCKIYYAVTYQDIYPNIDIRYYTNDNHLKYDFIVRPGGNVHDIALYFEGADKLKISKGNLIIKTSVGEIQETAPYSYQINNHGKQEVACSYELKGNILRFKIKDRVEENATLVIDPTLIFSTFTGSTADNWGYTATYDDEGNFYAGGIVFGAGFPTSNGAFQTAFQGGEPGPQGAFDIGIMKFNPTGTDRVYATYLGGAGNEQPHSLIVDKNNNLIVAGRTNSTNYPTTKPIYGAGGGWDIILTKLNNSGTAIINSMKIGGTGNDGVNIKPKSESGLVTIRRNYGDDARSEVIVDANDNIYLASCTQSTDFPTTAGAAQTVRGATNASNRYQDGVIIKASPDLDNILFSTLFGGNNDDAAFVLAINPTNNNIYVAGGTASTDLPGDKTGVLFPNNQGGAENVDGFVTILSNDGTQFIKTSYMGTNGVDIVFGVQFDKIGYPYIMGTTTGSWTVQNATFHQTNGKQFISKLEPNLSGWVYSTVFGSGSSSPNISPVAFLVDRCENVYVSGWGGDINSLMGYVPNQTTAGLSVTPDAIKNITDGTDLYFFVLEKNAKSLLYGSFFGQNDHPGTIGEHVDGGTSRFDKSGAIYQSVCANCGGQTTFPTTPGSWSPNNGTGGINCNLAAIKIAFNFAGVGSGVQSSIKGVVEASGCVPLSVTFTDTIANAQSYVWDFGDGSAEVTTTSPTIQHTYNNIGSYPVRLVSIDSNSCNIADTSYTTLKVRNDDAFPSFTFARQLPCENLKYTFTNTTTPPIGKPFKDSSFIWDFGDGTTLYASGVPVSHTFTTAGNYTVRLILNDTNYCNSPDTAEVLLRVSPSVVATFTTNSAGCMPYTAIFNNTSTAGTDFIWNFGDGSPVSTNTNPTHIYTTAGNYTVKLIAIDDGTCNKKDSTTFTITVSPNPSSSFTFSPNPPEVNTAINFVNTSSGGNKYTWHFGDGDSLVTNSINAIVKHQYSSTQTFDACLVVSNSYNCKDTSCFPIRARVSPLVSVPKAFTPNGDGINDVIYVQGFGIKKMIWRIFNRWGKLVFTGISLARGWNGVYNGEPLPQDVYNYTLDVEFSDGTKNTLKGDITLLR
ncbi:MAG: PKD domain-containing protein [Chitinophagaceae bacterium]|nr:PKD domain-containing protein [Chitinophagaceae bacterium]MCW5904619.1 PKD domain-containing protein [Chitinophagaceae bacterium]